jgi:hypothetical protein
LYFSYKNKKELAQARITKVVVYITTDPTKFVSQFSEFSVMFYTIYKNQQFPLTIEVYLLRKGPWKDWDACNVAPRGGWPARARQNPVRPAALAAGEGV